MKADENVYIKLVKKAIENKWCIQMQCTTCGNQDIRKEIMNIGKLRLLEALTDIEENKDNYKDFNQNYNILNVVELHLSRMAPTIKSKYMPESLIYAHNSRISENRAWKVRYRCNGKINEIEHRITKYKNEVKRLEKNLAKEIRGRDRSLERENIVSAFLCKNLEEGMLMIAKDRTHLPDYYPVYLHHISDETIATFRLETLHLLHDRFLELRLPKWVRFRKRLENVLEFRKGT